MSLVDADVIYLKTAGKTRVRRAESRTAHREVKDHKHGLVKGVEVIETGVKRVLQIDMVIKMAVKIKADKRGFPMHHPKMKLSGPVGVVKGGNVGEFTFPMR